MESYKLYSDRFWGFFQLLRPWRNPIKPFFSTYLLLLTCPKPTQMVKKLNWTLLRRQIISREAPQQSTKLISTRGNETKGRNQVCLYTLSSRHLRPRCCSYSRSLRRWVSGSGEPICWQDLFSLTYFLRVVQSVGPVNETNLKVAHAGTQTMFSPTPTSGESQSTSQDFPDSGMGEYS